MTWSKSQEQLLHGLCSQTVMSTIVSKFNNELLISKACVYLNLIGWNIQRNTDIKNKCTSKVHTPVIIQHWIFSVSSIGLEMFCHHKVMKYKCKAYAFVFFHYNLIHTHTTFKHFKSQMEPAKCFRCEYHEIIQRTASVPNEVVLHLNQCKKHEQTFHH